MTGPIPFDRHRAAYLTVPVLFAALFLLGEAASRALSYGVLAIGLWAAWSDPRTPSLLWARPFLAVAAYLTFGLVSVAWSGRGPGFLGESLGKYVNMLVFIHLVAALSLAAPAILRAGERVFVIAGALSAAGAIVLLASGAPSLAGERLQGLGSVQNSVVAGILYGAALLYGVVREWPAARSLPARLLILAAIAVLAAAVLLTHSRGPLLALAVTLAVGLAMAGRDGRRLLLLLIAGAAAAVSATIGWEALLERGFSYRIEIWEQAIEQSMRTFWFGIGMSSRVHFTLPGGFEAASPHNIFLSAFLTTGAVGLTLLVLMLAVLAREGLACLRRDGDPLPAALLLYVVVYGLVDRQLDLGNLSPEYFTVWYAAGLLTAAWMRRHRTAAVRVIPAAG